MRITESEPMGLFLYGIKSPVTKDRYLRRLGYFFDFLELQEMIDDQRKTKTRFISYRLQRLTLQNQSSLDDIAEHFLKEHNGNISGLREQISKFRVTLDD